MRMRSVKSKCGWKDCMCMRCKHACCIDHPDYLCPADLDPGTKERLAREYGFVLECPDFEPQNVDKEE